MDNNRLFIVGLGGHARVTASVIRAAGLVLDGFVDAFAEQTPEQGQFDGLPILGGISQLRELAPARAIIAIGDNDKRRTLCDLVRTNGISLLTVVHPRSFVESDVILGEGTLVCASASVCTQACVGDGVIINTGAIVEHECVLGDYCHISPGVRLAGRVQVGALSHVGIGATVIDKVRIGQGATVGAGAVVIRDVPDGATVVGVPAQIIKSRYHTFRAVVSDD
jgi:acetyltransferase EpsM